MFSNTPFLPGIPTGLFGRQRRSQLDRLRVQTEQLRQGSLSRLCEIFGPCLPGAFLALKQASYCRRTDATIKILCAISGSESQHVVIGLPIALKRRL